MTTRKIGTRKGLFALACVLAAGVVMPTTEPANAQQRSLFEIIFGNKPRDQRLPEREMQRQQQVARPAPKISAPKFYNYKPDILKPVDLTVLAEMEIAPAKIVAAVPEIPVGSDVEDALDATDAGVEMEVTSSISKPDSVTPADAVTVEALADIEDTSSVPPLGIELASADDLSATQVMAAEAASPAPAEVMSEAAATTKPDEMVDVGDGEASAVAETPAMAPEPGISATVPERTAAPVVEAMESPAIENPFVEARQYLQGEKLNALGEVGEALIAYYTAKPSFVWVEGTDANERAGAVLDALSQADAYGLSAADYRVEMPASEFDSAALEERQRALMLFEMNMSAQVLSYVLDATRGRVDPNRLSGYHDFKRKDVDLVSALENIASAKDAGAALVASNPDNRQFKALANELAELNAVEAKNLIEIAAGTFLKPGAENPELKNVVAAIRKRGSDKLLVDHGVTLMEYGLDGRHVYSPELVAMVKDFQKENGLSADGIVGRNTISRLTDVSTASKKEMIVLAMERLRWLPRNLGSRHVFINQPAYQATYINNDRDELSMRVVVGKKSNQTNFFQDEIETIEYNPYWGVPRSIIVNEMLPQLRRDPSYLDRQGYELTDRKGRRVASTNINWHSVGSASIPVDIRQPPGARNALGELKILFPNKHAIYMHDTPSKSLFNRESRALSHGCIRLHDPRGMAAAVLGSTREHIAQQIAQGRNKAEPVPGNIPVYVSYFTAWPNEDGSVGYYADMYDRDKRLNDAIAKTREKRRG